MSIAPTIPIAENVSYTEPRAYVWFKAEKELVEREVIRIDGALGISRALTLKNETGIHDRRLVASFPKTAGTEIGAGKMVRWNDSDSMVEVTDTEDADGIAIDDCTAESDRVLCRIW